VQKGTRARTSFVSLNECLRAGITLSADLCSIYSVDHI